ncbi:MAG TPA: hypothetical protein VN603_10830 [Candidatus Acidoferrales bacterium]|nr:hypothetical protein [Candidatus Acidoferrales bacterium]
MAENANSSGTGITQVATVFVPVADQDRALRFYLERLGFEKRADFQYGQGSRWLEVAPRGSPRQFFLRDTDGNRFLVVESA